MYKTSPLKLNLQLRTRLHPLKNWLQLTRLHNIPLNLQLASHKQFLRIRLALHQLSKVLVAQLQRNSRLLALGRDALANCTGFLQVDVPGVGCAGGVFKSEGEDRAAFFDRVLFVGGGGEGARYFVEGGGGGKGVWER